jgi:serine protease Do
MKRNAVAWAAIVISTAALVSSRGLTQAVPAAPEVPAEGQKTARALSEAFEAVADFVKPSVVQITVQRKGTEPRSGTLRRFNAPFGPNGPNGPNDRFDSKQFEDLLKRFFGPDAQPEREQFGFGTPGPGTGSGFVYDDNGHIMTNNHVVADAKKITVKFHDGIEANATVVGTDPGTDVAVIKVDQSGYRPIRKGDSSKLRVGEWVLAVGSPFGLSQTVTAGIISATERNPGINDYEAFIQTDASINPGNSGGPLVDMNGHVVGINSAIMTTTHANAGVGFAIPMDMAANVADKLIKDGKINRARLGITLPPLTPAIAKQLGLDPKTKGILVGEVVEGSPAQKAGLKQGDLIISFDGTPVYNGASLKNIVAVSDLGKSHTITFIREGRQQKVNVTLAPEESVQFAFEKERPEQGSQQPESAKAEINEFGLSVQELTPELASQFGYRKGIQGLVVTAVKEGSSAEAAGLEPGNLITKVIKDKKIQPIKSTREFEDLASKSDELALYVQPPNGPGLFVTLSKGS